MDTFQNENKGGPKMDAFAKLEQLHSEHCALWGDFQSAILSCKDLKNAIYARIERDHQARAELSEELRAIIEDDDRSDGSRYLAQQELEQLQQQRTAPTEMEIEMYGTELHRAEQTLATVKAVGQQYRAVHDDALVLLMNMRKQTLGNGGLMSADNRLADARRVYEKICGEVGGND